jgi:hypothetical protein
MSWEFDSSSIHLEGMTFISYLELSSIKNELLSSSFESFASIFMLEITYTNTRCSNTSNINRFKLILGKLKIQNLTSKWSIQSDLHQEIHFEYCSRHPSIKCILCIAVEHSGPETRKNWWEIEGGGGRWIFEWCRAWQSLYINQKNYK